MTNIGVFDSGLGGLAVLKELIKNHKANYFFLGDNKRVPYGPRDKSEIKKFSNEIVNYLEKFDIDFFVVACNTMSVNALDDLRKNFKQDFVSVTEMGIESALENDGDYLVLATEATVKSNFYKNELEKYSKNKVYQVACKSLVDYIENGETSGEEIEKSLQNYLEIANEKKIKNIILACTHYPIIEDLIRKNLTYDANIIDPAVYLTNNLNFVENEKTNIEIYMTKESPISQKMANMILNENVEIKNCEL